MHTNKILNSIYIIIKISMNRSTNHKVTDRKKIYNALNPIVGEFDKEISIYLKISPNLFDIIRKIKHTISDAMTSYIRITLLIEKNMILREQLKTVKKIQIELFEKDIKTQLKTIPENTNLNSLIERFINVMNQCD